MVRAEFLNDLYIQANVTRTNHMMWTMGDDFQYQYAESWFKQMDKLIHYVNKVEFNHQDHRNICGHIQIIKDDIFV